MKYIFGILFMLLTVNNVNAQFLKKLKNRVKQTAERTLEDKVNEKAEQTTEKALDSLFEGKNKTKDSKSDNGNTTSAHGMIGLMSQMGNASYESKYIFPITATIEIEDSNANMRTITMKQGYGKAALITEMENNEDPIIIDMKNQSAIILNTKNGTAQAMSLEWMQKMMGTETITDEESNDLVPLVKKTGQTKIMNGNTCHEYIIVFEEGKINAWYAPNVNFEYQDYLRGMAKLFSNKKEENPMQLLNTDFGYVMQMTFYNQKDEKQNAMKVIALDDKVRMINMDLFNVQKL